MVHGGEVSRSPPQVTKALGQGTTYRFSLRAAEADNWGAGEMLTIGVYGQSGIGITPWLCYASIRT